jgi:thiosulfate/3-mercaptopyruvate sulfurtransferase
MNIDVTVLLGAADDAAVRELVGEPAGTEVIAYCHSGSRSGLAVQLLVAAGYEARNYVGSWHEWSRDPELPAETGPTG